MDQRPEAVRDLSRLIFGGALYRIEVSAELFSGREFFAVDLVALLGDPPGKGSVHTELKRLREARMISAAPVARSSRAKPLIPAESSFWDLCRELRARAWAEADRNAAIAAVVEEAVGRDANLAVLLSSAGSGLSRSTDIVRTNVRVSKEGE